MVDLKAKSNAHIAKYFSGKKALIIDPTGVNRTSIKKTLLNLGLIHKNIGNIDTIEGAIEYFETNTPDILFVKEDLEDGKGLDLLEKHLKKVPNRLVGSFFLISEDNSLTKSTLVLDTECDAILLVPFTIQSIETTILETLKRKMKPSPYLKAVELGKSKYITGDFEAALKSFDEAGQVNPKPVLANYYRSLILLEQGSQDQALSVLLENLKQNEKHYKTLNSLGKIYFEKGNYQGAYDMECRILENYPLNAEKIPTLTRLSVLTEHYEDITNFAVLFKALDKVGENIQKFMCAGIAICGRFFVTHERVDEGVSLIEQAAKMANGRISVLQNLAESYLKMGDKEKAISLLEKFSNDKTDEEQLQVLFFEIETVGSDLMKVVNEGRKMINSGIKSFQIYDCMLKALIEGGAKFDKIEDLAYEAQREFPEQKDYLNSKISLIKESA